MAIKKTTAGKQPKTRQKAETEPKFPYTTKPSSLRRLLQEIPKKPKPPKFDQSLLKSWAFTDANDYSMIRVLKAVGLLNSNNEPTDIYARYMQIDGGAAALAEPIKRIYEPLFLASHTPYKESNEKLQNLFNIHSGGGERALDQQMHTFKALCEYTSFEISEHTPQPLSAAAAISGSAPAAPPQPGFAAPTIHINVHIHLPENKTRRDYEAMIEDIGRNIFGRADSGRSHE
jgi:Family of unknown function (DUF5343)